MKLNDEIMAAVDAFASSLDSEIQAVETEFESESSCWGCGNSCEEGCSNSCSTSCGGKYM